MAPVPTKQVAATKPAETLAERFQRLAASWQSETAYVSATSELVAHPAFREIVALGPAVVPLLLRELANRTGHWHRALREITGADPVPPEARGNLDQIAEAWLRWGKEQGYEW